MELLSDSYHSKVPYIQIVGEGGVLAGDIMGAYNYALADFGGGVLDDGNDAAGFTDLAGGASASQLYMQQALMEGAYKHLPLELAACTIVKLMRHLQDL